MFPPGGPPGRGIQERRGSGEEEPSCTEYAENSTDQCEDPVCLLPGDPVPEYQIASHSKEEKITENPGNEQDCRSPDRYITHDAIGEEPDDAECEKDTHTIPWYTDTGEDPPESCYKDDYHDDRSDKAGRPDFGRILRCHEEEREDSKKDRVAPREPKEPLLAA